MCNLPPAFDPFDHFVNPVDPFEPSSPPPGSKKDVELAQTQKPLDARRSLEDLLEVATAAHYAMADAVILVRGLSGGDAKDLDSVRSKLQAQCEAIRRAIGPRTHVLKTDPGPFRAVWAGLKPYEIRKFDRDFHVGDELKLVEFDRETSRYSGARIRAVITILSRPGEYGLPPDVGVLGISVVEKAEV